MMMPLAPPLDFLFESRVALSSTIAEEKTIPIRLIKLLSRWQQLTIVGAFQTAWATSDSTGRVGLIIHALLIIAAVCGLLGLLLYISLQATVDVLSWSGLER